MYLGQEDFIYGLIITK